MIFVPIVSIHFCSLRTTKAWIFLTWRAKRFKNFVQKVCPHSTFNENVYGHFEGHHGSVFWEALEYTCSKLGCMTRTLKITISTRVIKSANRYILRLLLWDLRQQGLSSKSITQQLNVEKQDDFYGLWKTAKTLSGR